MSFGPNNVLVLYNSNNTDSLTFAQYYQSVHGLADNQLIPLSCDSTEILTDYATFVTQIENPLLDALATTTVDVMGFMVGYGVPGGFYDGSDVIATTSRLARLNYPYSKQESNPLYNRAVFETYDDYTAAIVYIASRIDAPNLPDAMAVVKNANLVIHKSVANGEFFFDPYAPLLGSSDMSILSLSVEQLDNFSIQQLESMVVDDSLTDELNYFNDLLNFSTLVLPLLNLNVFTTTFWDEYTDVVIPRLKNDSFMWAWRADHADLSFFLPTSSSRVFLYNADADSASTMRDYTQRLFPMLAFKSGYVGSAGAMSDPTADGYLRPMPFFDALSRGATIGEAFVNACPYFDWTVSLLGDPLVFINFPHGSSTLTNTSTNGEFEAAQDYLASCIAYMNRKSTDITNAMTGILPFADLDKIPILQDLQNALNDQNSSWQSQMITLINAFVLYWSGGQAVNFDGFLTENSTMVSGLLPSLLGIAICSSGNVYPPGSWKIETPLVSSNVDYTTYQVNLQVASDPGFTNITQQYSSNPNDPNYSTQFSYEQIAGQFTSIPTAGISSGYVGRRVRFDAISSQYMASGTIFYWRVNQTSADGSSTDYVSSKAIINTW